jgi:eukaryotic-like serine/threonine-protein kinase
MRNYERRAQIEELFEAALEHSEADRSEWLEAECAGDAELLAEVQALLAAHELADQLFAEPKESPPGGRLGPYRILRELGRGGMGVVYLAERADGQFQRRVAIKLVGTTDADDPVHQRFLAERQILAGLDHPNIARLLDGGITEDGRPYLALEYVEGLPITTYCDRHRLSIEERLRLFVDVCEAVQHAHQNLVIHRDLKPSNIMVTAAGQVRLLDFGIAKLLNPALSSAASPATRIDLRAMTPEYASPEQVRGDALTTASDIYSLGVLLYEILTGTRPYEIQSTSPAAIAAIVCERDPERPSTRVLRDTGGDDAPADATTIGSPALSAAAARKNSAERLRRRLRGDLDSIVMMALRKEPGRRYASPSLLAQDIRRHLEGQPVLAHRGSRRYRMRKLLRRHRVAASAAALVFLSLVFGLGSALWQASVADRERALAERARVAAEQAAEQAEEVTSFLMGMFEAATGDPVAGGDEVTARDLLRRGAARADELGQHPEVQARMLDVIGQAHRHLGAYEDAQRLLERAVAIRRELDGPRSLDLASALIHLSWVHRSKSDRAAALALATDALEIRRTVLPPEHPDIALALYEVGRVTPDPREAERLYREAYDLLQLSGAYPERQVGLLQGLSTHARRRGAGDEAIAADTEALNLARQLFGPEDHRTGVAMIHLADHIRDIRQDAAEAERLYRQGIELIRRRYGDNTTELIHGLGSLAWLKSRQGEHEEALSLYRRSLAIRVAATGPEHPLVASHLSGLAGALERQGRLEEAEATAREAIELWTRTVGPGHRAVGAGTERLASILYRQGRIEEADRLYRIAIAFELDPDGNPTIAAERRRDFGRMLTARGAYPEAEAELLESLRALQERHGPDHPNTQETKRALMELYEARGDPEQAERYRVPAGRFTGY